MKSNQSDSHPEIDPWLPREELRRKLFTLEHERLELASEIAWLEGRVIALDFHLEEANAENERLRSEIDRLGNEIGRICHWKLWRVYLFYLETLKTFRTLPLIGRIGTREPEQPGEQPGV